jgi:hypothetical protein
MFYWRKQIFQMATDIFITSLHTTFTYSVLMEVEIIYFIGNRRNSVAREGFFVVIFTPVSLFCNRCSSVAIEKNF